VALAAAVLRINQFDVTGSTSNEVAHVMQHAGSRPIAETRFPAARTREMWIVATPPNDLCLGQIFRACDPLRGVWQYWPGPNTTMPSLAKCLWPGKYGIAAFVSWPISMRWC
jgi:hypothetical protein